MTYKFQPSFEPLRTEISIIEDVQTSKKMPTTRTVFQKLLGLGTEKERTVFQKLLGNVVLIAYRIGGALK